MAVLNTVNTAIEGIIEGLTTESLRGWPFRKTQGFERDNLVRETRRFRVANEYDFTTNIFYGGQSMELRGSLLIEVGYKVGTGGKQYEDMLKVINEDYEALLKALQSSTQSWPTGFCNLVVRSGNLLSLASGNDNHLILQLFSDLTIGVV